MVVLSQVLYTFSNPLFLSVAVGAAAADPFLDCPTKRLELKTSKDKFSVEI